MTFQVIFSFHLTMGVDFLIRGNSFFRSDFEVRYIRPSVLGKWTLENVIMAEAARTKLLC